MAGKSRAAKKRADKKLVVWASAAAALLLVGLLMLVGSFQPGEDHTQNALDTYRRVEFDLSYDADGYAAPSGEIKGKTISLADAQNMAKLAASAKGEPDEPAPENIEPIPAITEQQPVVPVTPEVQQPPQEFTPTELPDTQEGQTMPAETPAEPIAEAPAQPVAEPVPQQPVDPAAPILAPVEQMTEQGIVPVIAPNGEKAWRYFSKRGAVKTNKPRIAIAVNGLGLSALSTQAAIDLPPAVTLSFSPYGRETTSAMAQSAAAAGHEIMLDLPMQTERYPAIDPGPYGIRTKLSAADNLARMTTVLTKARGYIGLLGTIRDTVSNTTDVIVPLIQSMEQRGILYVAGHSQPPAGLFRIQRQASVPVLLTDIVLDDRITETHIRNQLARVEDRARTSGTALVVGHSYPLTVDLLAEWLPTLEQKGFAVVPVSALAQE